MVAFYFSPQFWVGAVIILGLLEKTFFVSEYSTINQGSECKQFHYIIMMSLLAFNHYIIMMSLLPFHPLHHDVIAAFHHYIIASISPLHHNDVIINHYAASGVIMVAEAVSAAKRALARMLLIIVSLGFGTVK